MDVFLARLWARAKKSGPNENVRVNPDAEKPVAAPETARLI